jgi:hypothetical protein
MQEAGKGSVQKSNKGLASRAPYGNVSPNYV